MAKKKLEVPVKDLQYVVALFGGGDLVASLMTKETWDSWSDEEDAMQFVDNIPAGQKLEFQDIHKLVNFCTENGIKLKNGFIDHMY